VTVNDRQLWLSEILALVPFASARDDLRSYLTSLLPRCHAKTRHAFVQWSRLQIGRMPDECRDEYLDWIQERHLPLNITPANGRFRFEPAEHGETALVDVGSDENPAVLRIPQARLEWLQGLYPCTLRQLPVLEGYFAEKLRREKARLRRDRWMLVPKSREMLERLIAGLEELEQRERQRTPIPRYQLTKSIDGREVGVHRLFMNAGPNDEVGCRNDNYLDYGKVESRIVVKPAGYLSEDLAWKCGLQEEPRVELIDNLYIVKNADRQDRFEDSMLQTKQTLQGDVNESPLKVQPNVNAGWSVGVDGKIEDLTEQDVIDAKKEDKK
jgi:hypothetical protein